MARGRPFQGNSHHPNIIGDSVSTRFVMNRVGGGGYFGWLFGRRQTSDALSPHNNKPRHGNGDGGGDGDDNVDGNGNCDGDGSGNGDGDGSDDDGNGDGDGLW